MAFEMSLARELPESILAAQAALRASVLTDVDITQAVHDLRIEKKITRSRDRNRAKRRKRNRR